MRYGAKYNTEVGAKNELRPVKESAKPPVNDFFAEISWMLLRFFKNIPALILGLLSVLRKDKWILTGGMLLGLLLGGLYGLLDKESYQSSMLIQSDRILNNDMFLEFDGINGFCKTGDYAAMGALLGLEEGKLHGITSIAVTEQTDSVFKSKYMDDNELDLLTSIQSKEVKQQVYGLIREKKANKVFEIQMHSNDARVFGWVSAPMLNFIEGKYANHGKTGQRIQNLKHKKSQIFSELKKLDELKEIYNKVISSGAQIGFSQRSTTDGVNAPLDPTPIYSMYIGLHDQIIAIDEEIAELSVPSIKLVHGFSADVKRNGFTLKRGAAYGALLGLLLVLTFVFLKQVNFKVKEFELYKINSAAI